jgi:hypothetical protein
MCFLLFVYMYIYIYISIYLCVYVCVLNELMLAITHCYPCFEICVFLLPMLPTYLCVYLEINVLYW